MFSRQIDELMQAFKYEGLTFDDISLITQYADFLPADTSVKTRFTRNVTLNIPFVSAAMDTVTESSMAIAMARLGGIGVIHKNLSIERQSEEVRKVKSFLNGKIKNPVTFNPEQTIADIMRIKREQGYSFSGFPIVDHEGHVLGLIAGRDIKFIADTSKKVGDVMTKEIITAPDTISIFDAYKIMVEHKVGKLPVVNAAGVLTGLYSFQDIKSLIEHENPDYNRDSKHQLRCAAGIGPYDDERIEALLRAGVDVLVLDTAHGHSKGVIETAKYIKKSYGDRVDLVAGNIATAEAAKALADAGVDAIKVGIGPGSICTTRVVAGVGIPQVTAVYEVSRAIPEDIPVIADGGIKQSGDVAKAIAFGASSVMMGSALAGTTESTGEVTLRERYGQCDVDDDKKLVPQGIEGLVPFRGPVADVIFQFVGGLRYALGYCGARTIKELQETAKAICVSPAGLREAHPHDVTMLKDAPNYISK